MDFAQLLRNKLEGADYDLRMQYYNQLRDWIVATLDKSNLPKDSEAYTTYIKSLETAIRNYEADRAVQHMDMHVVGAEEATAKPSSDVSSSPAPVARPKKRWATPLLVAGGAVLGILGYGAIDRLSTSSARLLANEFNYRMPKYQQNVAHLEKIRALLEHFRATSGKYPVTAGSGFVPLLEAARGYPDLEKLANYKFDESDTMIYRSTGTDYKLLVYRGGDCFVARILNPKLVDPVRLAGPIDCIHHGIWTPGGAGF